MSRGILRNSTYFPTFSNLPDENDTKDERRSRNETWCTLAEIVEDKMAFCWRHVVKVKDKNGYLFTVAFYVDNDDGPMPVNYQLYQGFADIILYTCFVQVLQLFVFVALISLAVGRLYKMVQLFAFVTQKSDSFWTRRKVFA